MAIIYDALRTMINLRQRENESLQEYTKRFKTSQEVMKSHLGGCIELPKYMAQMKEYDLTTQKKWRCAKSEHTISLWDICTWRMQTK
jgi:hypothetical protein